jgi:hypothetical protein
MRYITKTTHDLNDLEFLAKHWSVLFGRSLDPNTVLGVQGLTLHRADRLDTIDEKSLELQAAFRALDRLLELSENPSQRRDAEILLYTRVACGSKARQSGEAYLVLAQAYSTTKPKTLTEARRKKLIEQGRYLYNHACSLYLK